MRVSKADVKTMIVQEVRAILSQPEASRDQELKKVIKEEIEAHLLIEQMEAQILNEGLVRWLKKTFGQTGWEDLVDDVMDDGEIEKKKFLDLPSKQRVAALALIGLLSAGATSSATYYMDSVSPSEASAAQKLQKALEDSQSRTRSITNFRQMAQEAGFTGPAIATQQDINNYFDSIRSQYEFKQAPLAAGRGLFVHGDPRQQAAGFAYVPADQISDDTILPFVSMTKKDYEAFLRMSWLTDPGGEERFKQFVLGSGKRGSSVLWSYQNTLYAPVADLSGGSDTGTAEMMVDAYGPSATNYMVLPLEWSVAFDLLQKRTLR